MSVKLIKSVVFKYKVVELHTILLRVVNPRLYVILS